MSKRYPGGVITKSPATPTGPYDTGTAPGIWTLDQQMQYQQQGIWPTAGLQPNYIEDVFSTWLYTGNGSTQTITNNIDLSTKGGLVWAKIRDQPYYHGLSGPNFLTSYFGGPGGLRSNGTNALGGTDFAGVSTTGFNLAYLGGDMNFSAGSYVSWTFRKQAKFFDVVTYTGNGVAGTTIAHNLGSVPGCIIVKSLGAPDQGGADGFWFVYHRGLTTPQSGAVFLNNTDGRNSTDAWNNTLSTSTVFSIGGDSNTNINGRQYVAYLFAHNAGGFGLTGTDNVISCGTFTAPTYDFYPITLGYEPQWVLIKSTSVAGNWFIADVMRGASNTNYLALKPNSSAAEQNFGAAAIIPTATGFIFDSNQFGNGTYIYIAIRRGPMKVPTLGTSVFSPNSQNVSTGTAITTNFPPDLQLYRSTSQVANEGVVVDRLRGVNTTTTANSTPWLDTTTTAAEATASSVTRNWGNTGFEMPGFVATVPSVFYSFRRAPGFFDEVCYTGNGTAGTTYNHNLGVAPELWIVKKRSAAGSWAVGSTSIASSEWLVLQATDAKTSNTVAWNSTYPSSTVLTVGNSANTNGSGSTYVAYLFATCPGVSKVGSYTGNGTTQTINCGFGAGGARFVLIKRTDAAGDWYTYDTARGMTVLTDPYLFLNSYAAEVATLGSVTTVSTGFALNSSILAAINVNAGTYIFLAIA